MSRLSYAISDIVKHQELSIVGFRELFFIFHKYR